MTHIYHYHAQYQDGYKIIHRHGLYECHKKILGYEEYSDLEKFLSAHMIGNPDPSQILIESLSYMGEKE